MDPYEYHLEKCGIDSFKKLEHSLIHSFWPGQGEDIEDENDDLIEEGRDIIQEDINVHEIEYTRGDNEIVKIFNQKCVRCLERNSDYI